MTIVDDVVRTLAERGKMSFIELHEALGVPKGALSARLYEATAEGRIVRTGTKRFHEYSIPPIGRVSSVFDLGRLALENNTPTC
jgi:DNA-binding HxlR family transcriptional regulator